MLLEIPDLWVPAVAVFIPVLSALATRQSGSNARRAAYAVVASALLSVLAVAVADGATPEMYLATFVTVFITELVAYIGVWGPIIGINDLLSGDTVDLSGE